MEEIKILNEKLTDQTVDNNAREHKAGLDVPVQAAEIFNAARPTEEKDIKQLITTTVESLSNDAPLTLRQYDVVQVYDRESSHYGVYFSVGDVRGTKVHGYYFQPKGEKVYVTFNMDQLRLIGTARVRSKSCCSPKWASEYNIAQ